jgi:hypothetical protein
MIRQQPTPNPNAMKFTADRRLVEGRESRSYYGAAQAAEDTVAAAVFMLDGVENVFMADDFLTVTKSAAADWGSLAPRVIAAMEKVLAT